MQSPHTEPATVAGDPSSVNAALSLQRSEPATDWGVLCAGMAIAIIPLLIIYFLLQRWFMVGFTSGVNG